jgi:hypothetical protein
MIDPATLALAASAFAAVKKGIAFGKDIEAMYQDVSRWMGACHDIESKHTKIKRKKGQSVAEEALQTWSAVRKVRQQREELRLYLLSINPNAWGEFVQLEGKVRKQRLLEEAERRKRIKKITEVIILVAAMIVVPVALVALAWWVMSLRGR